MRFRFLDGAVLELEEAAGYYAAISMDLSLELRGEVDRALSHIRTFPYAAQSVDARHRSHKLRRFPYLLIYRVTGTELIIVAVAHAARKPGYWRRRAAKL
jgi:toxin ParE1/3/4